MHLAQDGAEDGEAAEEVLWYKGVAAHTHVKGTFTMKVKSQLPSLHMSMGRRAPQQENVLTITRFVETVVCIAIGCEDGDPMSAVLQSYCSVDDEPLGSANPQVRVKEDYVFPLLLHVELVILCLRSWLQSSPLKADVLRAAVAKLT